MNTTLFKKQSLPSLLDELNYFNFGTLKNYCPQANVFNKEDETIISLSVPGINKEDIKIEIENFSIIISSSMKEESFNDNYTYKEFLVSNFKRSFKLPEQSDIDQISSSLINGILTIKIPKSKKNIKLIDIQ